MTGVDRARSVRSTRTRMLGAGIGPGGARTLYRLGLLSAGKAAALVVLAGSVATGIVSVIAGTSDWKAAVAAGLLAAVARALLSWGARVSAERAALGAKEQLRASLAERLVSGGPVPLGSSTVLATRELDDLDDYYGSVLPAVMNAAVIPLLVGVRILSADWVSALVIVLTVPLIPVFMALVGMHTRDRVAKASKSLERLSDHLVELARGLPVLVGLGRVDEQSAALKTVSDEYRATTMATLRTAFLSSLVLELISTISVAVVAVFVGLRLLNGSLTLDVGLLALILAPECYAPFRELGSAFHASQGGVAALARIRAILAAPITVALPIPGDGDIRIESLRIGYPGRSGNAVDGLSATIPRHQTSALVGPSGSGKSSVLAVLAGRLTDGTNDARVSGHVTGIDSRRIAWVPQHPATVADTVLEELALYGDGVPDELVDHRIHELTNRFGLAHLLHVDPSQLSPGELRRVAIVRALLRIDAGAELLLLDEPTAHLDEAMAMVVEREISRLGGSVTIVLASHDPGITLLATTHIRVGQAPVGVLAFAQAYALDTEPANPAPGSGAATAPLPDFTPALAAPGAQWGPTNLAALGMLARFLAPVRSRFVRAVALGLGASLFAVALTAVSGWLIVRASENPAIMYLMVAIVGVRFFGIGRAMLRYGERLATHDAVFGAVGALRLRLWRALASRGAASRTLQGGGNTVDALVITADRVRDLAPRVLLPAIVGTLTAAAAIIAVGLLHPPAVPLLVGVLLVCLVAAPAVAVRADRHASAEQATLRSTVTRRFAALLGAAPDLRVNGVDGPVRADLRTLDRDASERGRRGAWAQGAGGAVVVAACCAASVLMLPLCWTAVRDGSLPGQVLAILVLLPLALLEPLLEVVSAARLWPALRDALTAVERIDRRRGPTAPVSSAPGAPLAGASLPRFRELELLDLSARWPEAPEPAFAGVSADAETGDWIVVQGPSGSGKSTLLTVLLGYLAPETGTVAFDGSDARTIEGGTLRRRIAWAPQEGHLFDSTVRGNLLLARKRGDPPTENEMLEVLRRVGLGGVLASSAAGLDTRVGSQGSHFSGGQRQRLAVARALLTRAEVLLLDEPTAHLDVETAGELMSDLRAATRDQITVLVTHHGADLRDGDRLVDLGSPSFAHS